MALQGLLNKPEISNAVHELVDACNKIYLNPSLENLNHLNSVCNDIESPILRKVFRYILIHLGVHLSKRDDTPCNVLQCFFKLLQRITVSDLSIFLEIYSLLFRQLQDVDSPDIVRETSEELKLEVLRCVTQLVKSSTHDVHKSFLCRKHYSKISIGVFYCTKIAAVEKFITLKVEALNCLLVLTHITDELHCCDEEFKDLADVLMLMVPGISSTCLKIVNNGDVQNHKPIVLAIRLWSHLVSNVMSLKVVESPPTLFKLNSSISQNDSATKKVQPNSPEEFMKSLHGVKLDEEWIKSTDKNLSSVSKMMVDAQNHQDWRVRFELASASYQLLSCCGTNISESVGYLAESLIFLSQDENNSVSEHSKTCIANLGNKCDELSNKRLVDIIEENFYALLTRLPRIFHGADITLKERQLILICGFLDMLGPGHVPALLRSSQHLERFIHCLVICATPDCSSISIMEEAALRGISIENYSVKPNWRHLKYCDSTKCEEALKNICAKLVQYSDLEMLISSLLDYFSSNYLYKKSITLLFILIFSSASPEAFQSHSILVKDIVMALMDTSLWNVSVCISEEESSKDVVQENIVQICLLAEAVGCISEAAGPTVFLPLLLYCLYPILECAGSPLATISCAGQISLQKLAKLYEDGSVSTVIAKNVDYLSHNVMLKLRNAHRNPRVLSVLSIIMEYSSLKSLPSLHDIINDVLIQSCDMFQDINGSAFLNVFHTYLACIRKWTTSNKSSTVSEAEANQEKSVISELLEYKEALDAADLNSAEPNDSTIDSYADARQLLDEEEDKAKKEETEEVKLPDHVKLSRDILKRSLHFLPADNVPRQILVLQIMQEGVEILASWTDVLLPVIHNIWSPFVERFKTSSNPLLLQRAFHLLKTLAKHSQDFIRQRTVKEILPCLCKFLKENSDRSRVKGPSDQSLEFTQAYKLQLQLLSGLGELAQCLQLQPNQLYPVIVSATPYLSTKQHSSLRDACLELFLKIGSKFGDLVWIYLISINPSEIELKAPCEGLPDYKFSGSSYSKEEYVDAVNELLSKLKNI